MDQSKHLGILGGSFDPVHRGHLELALETRQRFQLDRILMVPAYQSPHKREDAPAEARHRVNMLDLAIRDYPFLEIDREELDRGGISFTIDTVQTVADRHQEWQIHLIMGMDTFQSFGSWRHWEQILLKCHLLVSTRPGYSTPEGIQSLQYIRTALPGTAFEEESLSEEKQIFRNPATGNMIAFYPIQALDISSSEIRKALMEGKPVKNWLPPEVDRYIIDHRLYQKHPHPLS